MTIAVDLGRKATKNEKNEYAVGLEQGEVISTLLFSLYIEDLELFLQEEQNCGVR